MIKEKHRALPELKVSFLILMISIEQFLSLSLPGVCVCVCVSTCERHW